MNVKCLQSGNTFRAKLADLTAMSGSIRTMAEDLGEAPEIPVAGVGDDALRAILAFIERSCTEEKEGGNDTGSLRSMSDLVALACGSVSMGHDVGLSDSIPKIVNLVSATHTLDIPKLENAILFVVGTEISKKAHELHITSLVAPNGKLSIEGATRSEDDTVESLSKLVSSLRGIQPELVDCKLTKVVHEQQASFTSLQNYLVEKQHWAPTDAAEQVASQYNARARASSRPTLAESESCATARTSLYTPEAAAASWDGIEKHSIPLPEIFMEDAICKVLKQVTDSEITKNGTKVLSDLLAYTLNTVVTLANNSGIGGRIFGLTDVPTGSYLNPEFARSGDCGFGATYARSVTVLQTRTMPSDQVYLGENSDGYIGWVTRAECIRVGLGPLVSEFEAKDPAERTKLFFEFQKEHDWACIGHEDRRHLDSLDSRAIQGAVRRVYPGELQKHAVSEGTKAVTKFCSRRESLKLSDYGAERPSQTEMPLETGLDVVLTGLSKADMNGLRGTLEAYDPPPRGRWSVSIPTFGKSFTIKPENLVPAGTQTAIQLNAAVTSIAGLKFPVLKVAQAMAVCAGRPISESGAVYMAAVLEYIAAEVLELAGNAARDCKTRWIAPRQLFLATANDKELQNMYRECSILGGGVLPNIHAKALLRRDQSQDAHADPRLKSLKPQDVAQAFFGSGGDPEYTDDVFVCGTRVDGTDEEHAKDGWNGRDFAGELRELTSAGASAINDLFGEEGEEGERGRGTLFLRISTEERAKAEAEAEALHSLLNCPSDCVACNLPAPTLAPSTSQSSGIEAMHRRHYRLLKGNNLYGIENQHFMAMAARAGVLQVNNLCFEELRGIMKEFLEGVLRNAITVAEAGPFQSIVLASDCLAASMATSSNRMAPKLLCGTGRLAAMYANQCTDTTTVRVGLGGEAASVSPFMKLIADYSADVSREATNKFYQNYGAADATSAAGADDEGAAIRQRVKRADGAVRKLQDGCGEDGFDEAVSSLWRHEDEDEIEKAQTVAEYTGVDRDVLTCGRYSSGVEFKTEEDIKADPFQPWKDSLDYIRRMQRSTGPVIPFLPFVRLCAEIGEGCRSGLQFEPASFQALQSMVEDYLHTLLVDANLAVTNESYGRGHPPKVFPFQSDDEGDAQAMHFSRSLAITPCDLQLARRIRGERA